MRRFIALLNDGSFVNVPATRMEVADDSIRVWDGGDLVVYLDVGVVLSAHMSERKQENGG